MAECQRYTFAACVAVTAFLFCLSACNAVDAPVVKPTSDSDQLQAIGRNLVTLLAENKQLAKDIKTLMTKQTHLEAVVEKLRNGGRVVSEVDTTFIKSSEERIIAHADHMNSRNLQFFHAAFPDVRPQPHVEQTKINVSVSHGTVRLSASCSLILPMSKGMRPLKHSPKDDVIFKWQPVKSASSGLSKTEKERILGTADESVWEENAYLDVSGLEVPGSSVTFRFTCNWLGYESSQDVYINVTPKLEPAIDIGTSGICAGYVDANQAVKPIDLSGPRFPGNCIPSTVWLCPYGVRVGYGEWEVSGECTAIFDLKRQLGYFCELYRLGGLDSYPFALPSCDQRAQHSSSCNVTSVSFYCSGVKHSMEAEVVMGAVAKQLVQRIKTALNLPDVASTAYTFPPEFRWSQLLSINDMVRIADQNLSLHMPEPLAAITYILYKSPVEKHAAILVIDIGHGTTGIQVVQTSMWGLRAAITTGFSDRGGRDIDIAIQSHLNSGVTACSVSQQTAEKVKIFISNHDEFRNLLLANATQDSSGNDSLPVSQQWAGGEVEYCRFIQKLNNGGEEYLAKIEEKSTLTKLARVVDLAATKIFGKALPAKLDNTFYSIKRNIRTVASELSYSNLECIYVVGGASRIPTIERILRNHFASQDMTAPVRFAASMNYDPKEVVALGAAVQAARINKLLPSEGYLLGRSTHNSLRLRDRLDRCHQVIPSQSPMDGLELKSVYVNLTLHLTADGRKCVDLFFCESGISQTQYGGRKENLVTDCQSCKPVRFSQNQRICPTAIPAGYKKYVIAEVSGIVQRDGSTAVRIKHLWTENNRTIDGKEAGKLVSNVFSSDSSHFSPEQLEARKKIASEASSLSTSDFSCSSLPVATSTTPAAFCDRNTSLLLKLKVTCYDNETETTVGDPLLDEEDGVTILPEIGSFHCHATTSQRNPQLYRKGPTAAVIVFEQNSEKIVSIVKEVVSSFDFKNGDTYLALVPYHRTSTQLLPLTKMDEIEKVVLKEALDKLKPDDGMIMLRDSLEKTFDYLQKWLTTDGHWSAWLGRDRQKFAYVKTILITTGSRDDDEEDASELDVWNGYKKAVIAPQNRGDIALSQFAVRFVQDQDTPKEQDTSTRKLLFGSSMHGEGLIEHLGMEANVLKGVLRDDLTEVDSIIATDLEIIVNRSESSSALYDNNVFKSSASVSTGSSHRYSGSRFNLEQMVTKTSAIQFDVPEDAIGESKEATVSLKWRVLSPNKHQEEIVWKVRRQKWSK